jgi:hypothetical protein
MREYVCVVINVQIKLFEFVLFFFIYKYIILEDLVVCVYGTVKSKQRTSSC